VTGCIMRLCAVGVGAFGDLRSAGEQDTAHRMPTDEKAGRVPGTARGALPKRNTRGRLIAARVERAGLRISASRHETARISAGGSSAACASAERLLYLRGAYAEPVSKAF